jgi:PST family polysaccharide transporter
MEMDAPKNSYVELALAAASMCIGGPGVRQIAESVASGDDARIAPTVVVLRRTAVASGILGVSLLVAFARPVSALTFGNEDYSGAVALLALAVFFRLLTAGLGALIQGMRLIHDLAVMPVLGALPGTGFSIAGA